MLSQFHLFKTQLRHYNNDKTLHDHYATLNVPPSATHQDIRDAFLEQAKKVHPDKVTHLDEIQRRVAADTFKRLNDAYEILGDNAKRRQYDNQRGFGVRHPGVNRGNRNYKQFGQVTKRKRFLLYVNMTVVVLVLGLTSLSDFRTYQQPTAPTNVDKDKNS